MTGSGFEQWMPPVNAKDGLCFSLRFKSGKHELPSAALVREISPKC